MKSWFQDNNVEIYSTQNKEKLLLLNDIKMLKIHSTST